LRPIDTAARLRGDEFAVLLEDVPEAADAMYIAERFLDLVKLPFVLD
jgi:GGDEF domain-containing protein